MELSTLLGIAALALLGIILWFLWRLVRSPLPLEMQEALEKKTQAQIGVAQEEWLRRFAEEIRRNREESQGQMKVTESSVSQKLEEANRTYAQVREELGKLKEATEQVEKVGRDVASLQDLLRAPKMRGGFGEFFLAELLSQIMPRGGDYYALQYEFSGGERVDAVIRLGGRLVPVDAKFPLDQFRRMGQAATDEERAAARKAFTRDVKLHIDVIAQKYIRPGEGTYDFALMYIPAENVYYETIIKEDGVADDKGIFQHALKSRVIPVSPNSFYAYLQVILLGLKGLSIEQDAQNILEALMRLQRELTAVREDFGKAGKQLGFAVENFEKADKHLARFEGRLGGIGSDSARAVAPPESVPEIQNQ